MVSVQMIACLTVHVTLLHYNPVINKAENLITVCIIYIYIYIYLYCNLRYCLTIDVLDTQVLPET